MRSSNSLLGLAAALVLAGCAAVGPDYRRPALAVPEHFKEGVDWQRARPGSAQALRDDWWREYQDETLDRLVAQALQANPSIAAAEAAYRQARAAVRASGAALAPTVGASLGASRIGVGTGVPAELGGVGGATTYKLVSLDATVSWEPDLWGAVRRNIEAAKAGAQASDAERAGVRLSIAASVVADYLALRQADADIVSAEEQRGVYERLLGIAQASWEKGGSSHDEVLNAQAAFDSAGIAVRALQAAREQDEHAIAALLGLAPAAFSLPPQPGWRFVVPAVPALLPSQLLERRYDVVNAERLAAAANAKIGVAQAAFFPSLALSAEGGFGSSSFGQLLSLPSRMWTLGPSLAASIFDGGAREAAVASARASYDEDVAVYRNTVIASLQSVEDSLSALHHLGLQAAAQERIVRGSERLYASASAQQRAGASSEQQWLVARLGLLQARQNLVDRRAAWSVGSVTLIRNLGGGWRSNAAADAAAPPAASAPGSAR